MCIRTDLEGTEATRLRRAATVLASCAAMAPALSMTHGYPVLRWAVIAVQVCLVGAATKLLVRAKRLG